MLLPTTRSNVRFPVIPRLRPDVTVTEDGRGGRLPFAATDRALGQRVRLDPRGAAIALALDTTWHAPALLDHLVGKIGVPLTPELLVQFVRFLDGNFLLDTDRADRHVRAMRASDAARKAREGQPPVVRFLAGSQHNCVACGHSCEAHDIGPIAESQVAVIRAAMPGAQFLARDTGDTETTGHYCRMKDDKCAFLRDDQLCSVHARLGMAQKPTDCRVFPLSFTATPEGFVAGIRMECRSYLASKRNGGALVERNDELVALASELPTTAEVPIFVRLDGKVTTPHAEWALVRDGLIDAVPIGPTILAGGLVAFAQRARTLVDAVRATERDAFVVPLGDVRAVPRPLAEVFTSLADAMVQAAAMNRNAGNVLRAERLTTIAASTRRLATQPLVWPAGSADDDELLRDHLTQSLFLEDPVQGPHVRFGLAVLVLTVVLAVAAWPDVDHLNGALADVLKALRSGPVIAKLQALDESLVEWFLDRFDDATFSAR